MAEKSFEVVENELILEKILSNCSFKSLSSYVLVSKKWERCCNKIKRRRKALGWLAYILSAEQEMGKTIEDQIQNNVDKLSSQPKFGLVFCGNDLENFRCKVSPLQGDGESNSLDRPVRKTRSQEICVEKYLRNVLPQNCELHGIVTDGIIATNWENETKEIEEPSEVLSCLLIPELPGIDIYSFYEGTEDINEMDFGDLNLPLHMQLDLEEGAQNGSAHENEKRRAGLFQKDGSVNMEIFEQVTSIPSDKKVRLVLLFEWSSHMSGWSRDLSKAFFKLYGNVVVAGGVVDKFFTERESVAHNVHGIAFCGSEEDLKIASVVVPNTMQSPRDIENSIKKLKSTNIPQEKTVAFMLTCLGRGKNLHDGIENLESGLFRKIFPQTPLFGGFLNGEIGMDYLPDYSAAQGDHDYIPTVDGNPVTPDKLCRTYSSVFVLMSFNKSS